MNNKKISGKNNNIRIPSFGFRWQHFRKEQWCLLRYMLSFIFSQVFYSFSALDLIFCFISSIGQCVCSVYMHGLWSRLWILERGGGGHLNPGESKLRLQA
jgi:hypothetical protein